MREKKMNRKFPEREDMGVPVWVRYTLYGLDDPAEPGTATVWRCSRDPPLSRRVANLIARYKPRQLPSYLHSMSVLTSNSPNCLG